MPEIAPEKPALLLGDAVRTYGELNTRSNQLAHALIERGVPTAGSGAVAAMPPDGFEFFEVARAACRAEARFLPVNWHLKADELAYILSDSGAQVLVTHESLRGYAEAAVAEATATALLVVGDGVVGHGVVGDGY